MIEYRKPGVTIAIFGVLFFPPCPGFMFFPPFHISLHKLTYACPSQYSSRPSIPKPNNRYREPALRYSIHIKQLSLN